VMRFLARLESDFEKYSGHGSGGAVTVNWRRGATSWARASTTKTYDTDQASKRLIAFAIPAPERRRRRWVALSAIQERATRSAKPIAHFVVLQTVIVRPGKFPQPNQQNQMEAVFQQFRLEVGVPFRLRLRGLLVATGLLCLHLVRAAALSGAPSQLHPTLPAQ
jgi:hypothetical protein